MITLPLKNDNLRAESIKVIESKQTEVFDQRPLMCKYSFPFPSFRLFWTKNWSKKPRWKSYFLCQNLNLRFYLSFSPFFPYSNKSENLCNNFDFLKINKTKNFGSKNSGLFCNLQAILIYMLPEAIRSMLWKKYISIEKTTFIV